jgi:type I restriction-modification system DNA methylase subunit
MIILKKLNDKHTKEVVKYIKKNYAEDYELKLNKSMLKILIEKDNKTLKGVLPKDYARPSLDKTRLGEEITLTVKKIGISDMALAVEVEGFQTKNDIPHITIAINPDGGKPVMSNDITKWEDVKSFMIKGIVSEIKHT